MGCGQAGDAENLKRDGAKASRRRQKGIAVPGPVPVITASGDRTDRDHSRKDRFCRGRSRPDRRSTGDEPAVDCRHGA